jgi:TolB protein
MHTRLALLATGLTVLAVPAGATSESQARAGSALLVAPLGAPTSAASGPRTLFTTRAPVWAFAQDGNELAWVTSTARRGRCGHDLQLRPVGGGRAARFRIGCSLSPALALAGRTALWKTFEGGGNTEQDVEVRSARAGDRRLHSVEQLLMSIDLDSGLPNPDPPLAGEGALLAYYAEDVSEGANEHAVRRVVRGQARTVFTFARPLALATDGRRLVVVRQQLGGDGCGCSSSGSWSPDGRRIAFLDGEPNIASIEPAEIAIVSADGSGRTRITHDGRFRLDVGAGGSALDWSPDGQMIAYSYLKGGGAGYTIAVVGSDDRGERDLGPGREPTWSPDGATIAFSGVSSSGVFVMNADGSAVRQVAGAGTGPAWSPDGTRLAFASSGGLSVVNADGGGLRQLVSSGPYVRNPDWSPDGSRIAFGGQASFREKGGIWVVNADGTGLRQLTAESDDYPRWSPDGTRILFTSARDDLTHVERLRLELYTMNSDGTGVHPLTFTQPAEWVSAGEVRSVSGTRLATFTATGAPAVAHRFGNNIAESRSVAVGGGRVAVLSVLARTGRAQMTLFAAAGGAPLHVVSVPSAPPLELAGISGRRVVFRSARTIRVLNGATLRVSTLATLAHDPVGLSVTGRRVAWAENSGSGGRIRALTLPG